MKNTTFNYFSALLLLLTASFYAQNKGIAYQAVIFRPDTKAIPGVAQGTVPLSNAKICLRFTFLDSSNKNEYQETLSTSTDAFGIVNATIGTTTQTGGYAKSFNSILFNSNRKTLVVELDIKASCSSFEEISSQYLESSPFSIHSNSADTITGIVAIANGGTGATTAVAARKNLGLETIENKSKATGLGNSDDLYPTQNAVKAYVDSKIRGVFSDAPVGIKDTDVVHTAGIETITGAKTFSGGTTFVGATATVFNDGDLSINGGNVSIGGAKVSAIKLQVKGAVTNETAFDAGAGTAIDFANSNLAFTTASGASATPGLGTNFKLSNMKTGGVYTLAVKGDLSGTPTFAATAVGGGAIATHGPINNGPTIALTDTIYTFVVMGTDVYISMVTGL